MDEVELQMTATRCAAEARARAAWHANFWPAEKRCVVKADVDARGRIVQRSEWNVWAVRRLRSWLPE